MKLIINLSGPQMRQSIYVFQLARREERFAFDEVGQVGLANLGSRLSRLWLVQHPKSRFLRPSAKCDDVSMFSGRFDDRIMMMKSIMHFGQF